MVVWLVNRKFLILATVIVLLYMVSLIIGTGFSMSRHNSEAQETVCESRKGCFY